MIITFHFLCIFMGNCEFFDFYTNTMHSVSPIHNFFYKTGALNEILKSFLGSGHGHCWRFFNRSIRGRLIRWGQPAQSRRSNGGQQRWFKWLINDDRAKCIAQCRPAKIVWPV